jgi:RecA-family ATPase
LLLLRAATASARAKCEQGDVLYLALENNERRLQRRITKILGAFSTEWPTELQYATEWPRVNEGGVEAIRNWIVSAMNPRLVIVDVLAMFRPRSENRDNLYEADYHAIQGLQALAGELNVSIVIVHHVRKSGSDVDPFEKVSGTLGCPERRTRYSASTKTATERPSTAEAAMWRKSRRRSRSTS